MAKKEYLTSPKGKAEYAWLTKADTKFDPDGKYKVNLIISAKAAKPLIERCETMAKEALAEAKKAEKNPVKAKKLKLSSDKPYTENEDGTVTFKFSMKAKGKVQKTGEEFTQKPKLFDAKLKTITGPLPLGNGSVIRVSYDPFTYKHPKEGVGVSLRLYAVQVLELVPYESGGDGTAFGFEADEDGYSADDSDEENGGDDEAGDEEGAEDESEDEAGDDGDEADDDAAADDDGDF